MVASPILPGTLDLAPTTVEIPGEILLAHVCRRCSRVGWVHLGDAHTIKGKNNQGLTKLLG